MTTDRAKRYAANRDIADDQRAGCLFCGSHRNLTADHLDGFEEHGEPENLAWLCKSCNTRKGTAFRRAGVGRPTNQYNPPFLGLSPAERRNFSQLGFDFPPRADYDQARAAERKRRVSEHAAAIKQRRVEKAGERRHEKEARAEEQKQIKARISDLGASLQKARRAGDKQGVRALNEEINWLNAELRKNPPRGGIASAGDWARAVAASMGSSGNAATRVAARRIRATSPATRRRLAAAIQSNPAKYPTFAQYGWAVSQHQRGEHDAGGAIIHQTPKRLRKEYASRIADIKRARGTAGRRRDDEVPF